MTRFWVTSFAAIILVLANYAFISSAQRTFDERQHAAEIVFLTEDDIIPSNELAKDVTLDQERAFIGDLKVGSRQDGETVFRRYIDMSNPFNSVYNKTYTFVVQDGIIHYLRLTNNPGSYAVACGGTYIIGSSNSIFNLRVGPFTESVIKMIVAAH